MTEKSNYRSLLKKTLDHSLEHLESLDSTPVSQPVDYAELYSRLNHPLTGAGAPAETVLDDIVSDSRGGILGCAGGRFFGWVIGGSLPSALAADWMVSAWDQNAAIYAGGPAVAVMEEIAGKWVKELLGLPAGASIGFVTGSQMAHVTCLAAARHQVLDKAGWDVEADGLNGAPKIHILTGSHRHGSIDRAVRLLGLGRNSVVDLPLDGQGRLTPDVLEKALKEHTGQPVIVLLQAGDLNIGAFDPFAELIPLAHNYGAWVHVDGAFGLWVGASPKYRHLVKGYEQADSWVTDGHKWLNTPYDCGYAIIANPEAHIGAMSYTASYMVYDKQARDAFDWNPEWSRRARGVATYAAIREMGRDGVASLVERTCGYAHDLVTRIGALPGAVMVSEPRINQGLVRYLAPSSNATEADHDAWTDRVIAEIQNTGEAFFGGTTWQGKRCMRVSVCNWKTTPDDVDRSVNSVSEVLTRLRSGK
jgi:glutamate/tyrosine decarboxylase-like PLP-dependent enzyme